MSEHCVVLVTCPDRTAAEQIAGVLVEERLAACVNLLGGLTSIYRWEGEVRRDAEVLLVIKTRLERFPAVENRVKSLHPYEVPEVIACAVAAGSLPYLEWINENTP